jgi:hypothetical protein
MKLTKNFDLKEFVPVETYKQWGNNAIWFIDKDLALGAQLVRDMLEKIFVVGDNVDIVMSINTAPFGGQFNYRGYRPPKCNQGATESQHRFGRAIDFDITLKNKQGGMKVLDSLEVQKAISAPDIWPYLAKYFTTMESGTKGWTHLDMRFIENSEKAQKPFLVPIP